MEFDYGDEPANLRAAVFQAVGAGSMCWENIRGAGVFDSEQAVEVGEALLAEIERLTTAQ